MKLTGGIAVVVLLAACGSSKPTAAPPSAAPTTTAAVATAAPTLWTKAEAGQQYLALVAPGNALIDQLRAYGKDPATTLAQWNGIGKQLAASDDRFARALLAGKWPVEVQADVKAMVAALLKERLGYAEMSTATSIAGVAEAIRSMQPDAVDAAAKATSIRIGLGLKSN